MYLLDFTEDKDAMLSQTETEWEEFSNDIHIGDEVCGRVAAQKTFGVYVDFGKAFPALIEVVNFAKERYPIDADGLPTLGEEMQCKVIQIVPSRRTVRAVELS